jgi:hypothetical protein
MNRCSGKLNAGLLAERTNFDQRVGLVVMPRIIKALAAHGATASGAIDELGVQQPLAIFRV